jgi:hypothetical protein
MPIPSINLIRKLRLRKPRDLLASYGILASFSGTYNWLQPNDIGCINQQTSGNLCENSTHDSSNCESTRPQ